METTPTTTPQKNSSKDFFIYCLIAFTFYASMIALINLVFMYINVSFPDIINRNEYSSKMYLYSEMIVWISMLLVLFPVYASMTWYARKDIIQHSEKAGLWIRKVFINFTLFLAFIAMISDVITIVYNVLDGEISIRFLMKAFALLFIAGAIFSYYFYDLRRETNEFSKPSKWIAMAASGVIFLTILAGFAIIGTPMQQRMRKLDENRVRDLQLLQSRITTYWNTNLNTPPSLNALKTQTNTKDAETGKLYEYIRVNENEYQLCAEFSSDNNDTTRYYYSETYTWATKGRHCFNIKIQQTTTTGSEKYPYTTVDVQPVE